MEDEKLRKMEMDNLKILIFKRQDMLMNNLRSEMQDEMNNGRNTPYGGQRPEQQTNYDSNEMFFNLQRTQQPYQDPYAQYPNY